MKRLNLEEFNKLYYSIGEIAELFQVNASLIRFWEKEFAVLSPKKNKKGNRQFTVKDIANIERIYILVKEQGFTLDGAKKALKHSVLEDETSSIQADEGAGPDVSHLVDKLESIKRKLLELKHT